MGLASSGAVAALQGWLGHVLRRRAVSADVAVVSTTADGRTQTRVDRFEGSGEEISKVLAGLEVTTDTDVAAPLSEPEAGEEHDH